MPISVKLDEALSGLVAEPLRQAGYDVCTVRGQGWAGFKDSALWPPVQAERIFFITADKEFGDTRKNPPGTHSGVLLLRPARESVVEYARLVQFVLDRYSIEQLLGTVAVATPGQIRIRRA